MMEHQKLAFLTRRSAKDTPIGLLKETSLIKVILYRLHALRVEMFFKKNSDYVMAGLGPFTGGTFSQSAAKHMIFLKAKRNIC